MELDLASLPDDAAALRAIVLAQHAGQRELIGRLRLQLARLRRMQFGRSSERVSAKADQLELALEDMEADAPAPPPGGAPEDEEAGDERRRERRKPARRSLPEHLTRETVEQRPRGLRQQGYDWAFLFGAVRPATGEGFALVLPEVSTTAAAAFLERFAATRGPDAHAVLVLDQAGWHASRSLDVPPNVTLVPLPPYAPELNPVERVWLYLRERFLSHRLLEGYDAFVDTCCEVWNALTPERIRSLTAYPWIARVTS